MAKKTSKTAEPTKQAKKTPAKPVKATAEPQKKLSGLDAAAKVLGETSKAMNCRELVQQMAAKGYWTSPGGATPWGTLSAIDFKQMGVGLAASILIDATIIRGVLLPATLALLGDRAWYLPAWLEAKGLDAREIGIVLAVPMLIRIVAVPFATRLVDRRFDQKTALTAAAALSAAGYAVMGTSSGFVAIVLAYVVVSIVSSPVLPLADSFGLRHEAQVGRLGRARGARR